MANIMFDSGYMPLPINIQRGNPVPLDASSVFYPTAGGPSALANAQDYAQNNPVAYVGQIITVCEGTFTGDSFIPNMAHENSGIYYIADRAGTLIKLVNNAVYTDDKKEDIEVDYSKILSKTIEGVLVTTIIAPKPFKKGTSDLFINGIKYNNSEYVEILAEGKTDICDRIEFKAFEIIPQKDGVGDEITIMADYE